MPCMGAFTYGRLLLLAVSIESYAGRRRLDQKILSGGAAAAPGARRNASWRVMACHGAAGYDGAVAMEPRDEGAGPIEGAREPVT